MIKTLTVKEGKHDFKPSKIPWPMFTFKELKFRFKPDPNCWYNSLGSDNYDFNKAVGVYDWLDFKKNENALILGFRPDLELEGFFQYVPYENYSGLIKANEELMFSSNDWVNGKFVKTDTIELHIEDKLWYKSRLDACVYGIIDSWFGGNRTAPHQMSVQLEIL